MISYTLQDVQVIAMPRQGRTCCLPCMALVRDRIVLRHDMVVLIARYSVCSRCGEYGNCIVYEDKDA